MVYLAVNATVDVRTSDTSSQTTLAISSGMFSSDLTEEELGCGRTNSTSLCSTALTTSGMIFSFITAADGRPALSDWLSLDKGDGLLLFAADGSNTTGTCYYGLIDNFEV